ncbi:7-carboxy-7-deazaguanine synthase QueE [[Limnothrix rosea] IAM M-220]|uniref:7-carboxy-7-deazaguanine synthase QueE n=1 Tax=[Limnothrix rosea] IAM M-220 TaxID=454133 RepID=UPI000964B3AA|nr:7-carboxy-7-deazaguanine synthase QueE [[Limnothrix rosea] IAM M-220]OKH10771.1 7-carboxy-7-deazaguanine synthase QueE [[Limnothrix rosea] IAM M-220]
MAIAANAVSSSVLVSPTDLLETKTYPIVETFHSLQGEGQWFGVSAFFIRLAGCDVGCPWCDTKISWNPKRHPPVAIAALVKQVREAKPRIIVVTGGEPLMHDLQPLTDALKPLDIPLHLETSGSHALSGQFDWITLSPKTFKPPLPDIYAHVDELKVVIDNKTDLDWAEAEANKINPTAPKYLQPQWENPASQDLIFQYILQHPDWRLGLQTHKFLGVR